VRPWKDTWQYRHTCAAFAAVNIFLLMTANLVGFVVGIDGVHEFINQVSRRPHTSNTSYRKP
jgi:hypothetical protein